MFCSSMASLITVFFFTEISLQLKLPLSNASSKVHTTSTNLYGHLWRADGLRSSEYKYFNVIKYINLERLTKLNKNVYKKNTLICILLIDFYIKLYKGLFLMFQKKIILEINNTNYLLSLVLFNPGCKLSIAYIL